MIRFFGTGELTLGRSVCEFFYTLTPAGKEALRTIRKIYNAIWSEDSKMAFE